METEAVKRAVGLGTGGAIVIGSTSYGAYSLVQPKTMGDQLAWEGYELFDVYGKGTDEWKDLAKLYPVKDGKSQSLDGKNSVVFTSGEYYTEENLKEECRKALDEKLTHTAGDNSKLDAIKTWCAKPKKEKK